MTFVRIVAQRFGIIVAPPANSKLAKTNLGRDKRSSLFCSIFCDVESLNFLAFVNQCPVI